MWKCSWRDSWADNQPNVTIVTASNWCCFHFYYRPIIWYYLSFAILFTCCCTVQHCMFFRVLFSWMSSYSTHLEWGNWWHQPITYRQMDRMIVLTRLWRGHCRSTQMMSRLTGTSKVLCVHICYLNRDNDEEVEKNFHWASWGCCAIRRWLNLIDTTPGKASMVSGKQYPGRHVWQPHVAATYITRSSLFLIPPVACHTSLSWAELWFIRNRPKRAEWDHVTRVICFTCLLYTSPSPRD